MGVLIRDNPSFSSPPPRGIARIIPWFPCRMSVSHLSLSFRQFSKSLKHYSFFLKQPFKSERTPQRESLWSFRRFSAKRNYPPPSVQQRLFAVLQRMPRHFGASKLFAKSIDVLLSLSFCLISLCSPRAFLRPLSPTLSNNENRRQRSHCHKTIQKRPRNDVRRAFECPISLLLRRPIRRGSKAPGAVGRNRRKC